MHPSQLKKAILAAVAVSGAVDGLNILITNDDGFGTANIREFYKAIKAYGHQAYIVASTSNQSGMGGTVTYAGSKNLTADTEFGIVKAGAPSIGTDPNDFNIWYFNGTPSACVQVALDYVLPNHANFSVPDLVLSGPNYGLNLGPFLYTLSGTIGGTYTAIERGIPAIGYSGGYAVQTAYYHLNATTSTGLQDPATIYGQLAADLAQQLILNVATKGGGRLLPLGYGISVNIPYITSYTNASCVAPPYVFTRLTGRAVVDKAVYNESTGLFTSGNLVTEGVNPCLNGDCTLPGETEILASGCRSSVSIFTVDYDAPSQGECGGEDVRSLLTPLVGSVNSTGMGNGNGTVGVGVPVLSPVTSGVGRISVSWIAGIVGLVVCMALEL